MSGKRGLLGEDDVAGTVCAGDDFGREGLQEPGFCNNVGGAAIAAVGLEGAGDEALEGAAGHAACAWIVQEHEVYKGLDARLVGGVCGVHVSDGAEVEGGDHDRYEI